MRVAFCVSEEMIDFSEIVWDNWVTIWEHKNWIHTSFLMPTYVPDGSKL